LVGEGAIGAVGQREGELELGAVAGGNRGPGGDPGGRVGGATDQQVGGHGLGDELIVAVERIRQRGGAAIDAADGGVFAGESVADVVVGEGGPAIQADGGPCGEGGGVGELAERVVTVVPVGAVRAGIGGARSTAPTCLVCDSAFCYLPFLAITSCL